MIETSVLDGFVFKQASSCNGEDPIDLFFHFLCNTYIEDRIDDCDL